MSKDPQIKPITAVRRLQFCAGHRVYGHESKCANLHGHNYQAFFHARSETGLDQIGRVIDFGVLKDRLGSWIEDNWDHGMVLWKKDVDAIDAVQKLDGQKLFLLDDNPTAENLAAELLCRIAPEQLKGTGVLIEKVVLWETENCFAEVELYARTKSDQAAAAHA